MSKEEISILDYNISNNSNNLTTIDVESGTKIESQNSYLWGIIQYIIFDNFISKKLTNYFKK